MHSLGFAAIACGAIASLSLNAASASFFQDGDSIRLQVETVLHDDLQSERLTEERSSQEDERFKRSLFGQVELPAPSSPASSEPPPSIQPISAPASFSAAVVPETIQLGDTLTVRIELPNSSPAPTVAFGDRQFPAFPVTSPVASSSQVYRALVPSSPLDRPGAHTLTVMADGDRQTLPITIRARTFPTQSITIGSGGLQATQAELDAVSSFKAISSPVRYWNGPFLRPSGGQVSSIYGVRRYYNGVFANDYYHRGVDYAAPLGSPIVAPAAGTIALVGRETEGFTIHGNTVGIDHGQGVVSIFLHLDRISVVEGQQVDAGQQVGTIGTTGASTGPHLHWGLYVHEVAVDPVPWRNQGFE